jgi:rRNA maturation endonuclease Nob1
MTSNLTSLADRLTQQLQTIEDKMMEFLDASNIKVYRDPPGWTTGFPDYSWGETNEKQTGLQIELKKKYSSWFENFSFLFQNFPNAIEVKIKNTDNFVIWWIERTSIASIFGYDIPPTIQEAKIVFKNNIKLFYDLLSTANSNKDELILAPDTNSLIKASDFSAYKNIIEQNIFTMIIVPTVLSELDDLKNRHRDESFRKKVESVINRIKGLRNQGKLSEGVKVDKTITIKTIAQEPNFKETLSWLDSSNNDDRIIASVLEIQRDHPSAIVVLVTADINFQNKADMANLPYLEPPK